MQTIRLKLSEKVNKKVLELVLNYGNDDVEINTEQDAFTNTKAYLHKELDEINSGKAEFHSLEEANEIFERTIRSHEDKA